MASESDAWYSSEMTSEQVLFTVQESYIVVQTKHKAYVGLQHDILGL